MLRPVRAGGQVILYGSKERPDLNGEAASLLEWNQSRGQWRAELRDGGECISVGTNNVLSTAAPDAVTSHILELIARGRQMSDYVRDAREVYDSFVDQLYWPQSYLEDLLDAAWRADEERGIAGTFSKYGGMLSTLFIGVTECQVRLGLVESRWGSPKSRRQNQGPDLDNAAMALFSYALDSDNPRVLTVLYQWNPDFEIHAWGGESLTAVSEDSTDTPSLSSESSSEFEIASMVGAHSCLDFLRQRSEGGDDDAFIGIEDHLRDRIAERVRRARLHNEDDDVSECGCQVEPLLAQSKSSRPSPGQVQPSQPSLAQQKPSQPSPAQLQPSQPSPVQLKPSQPSPAQPKPQQLVAHNLVLPMQVQPEPPTAPPPPVAIPFDQAESLQMWV